MLFWIQRVSPRLARVNTSGEGLGIVCGLAYERFALFHFPFPLFGKATEFQDRLRTGRPVLVFGNDSCLKLCQTTVVWPASSQAQASPPGTAGPHKGAWSCWQPWSPCPHLSWKGAFARPPEFSSQIMSYCLFCHTVGSKEMLWGGICHVRYFKPSYTDLDAFL